jgi:hypothetical protein
VEKLGDIIRIHRLKNNSWQGRPGVLFAARPILNQYTLAASSPLAWSFVPIAVQRNHAQLRYLLSLVPLGTSGTSGTSVISGTSSNCRTSGAFGSSATRGSVSGAIQAISA